MTIALFGATGRTGKLIIQLAIKRGYNIKAHCRNALSLAEFKDSIEIFEGSLEDNEVINNVITGSDTVVIAFGQRKNSSVPFTKDATEKIIDLMKQNNVTRLICLTGALIGQYECRTILFELIRKIQLKRNYDLIKDRDGQEDVVMGSYLDWTIVKPPRLVDTPAENRFITGTVLKVGFF